ncbi:MAG: tetratricopeptide repeat protein [Candidatus Edwardsbacteria bacterium]|nr:tetratricopeptide repeat protein [Candidatus Edwardsbacteria bacterium]
MFAAAQRQLRAGKTDEAAQALLEVAALPGIEHDEPLALESAHAGLADIYLKLRRIELAEYHLGKALAVSPQEADLHHRLGELRSYKGEFAAAAEAFLRASELEPSHPGHLHRLGWSTFMAGEQKKGRAIMAEALTLDEANTALLADLAVACSELGDHRAALKYLDQAVDLDPGNELLRSQRERMREKTERTKRDR